ncbi:MAG: flagellar FliJ family protein [Oceanipulchritudo sp.]
MRRFRFSLESVLTLRKFRKSEKAAELSVAMRRRMTLEERLGRCQEALGEMEDRLRETLSGTVRAQEVLLIQDALRARRGELATLRQSALESLEKENRAREAVKAAQQECEALVRLEERQREEARKEAEKEDEMAMEEFVMARGAVMEN